VTDAVYIVQQVRDVDTTCNKSAWRTKGEAEAEANRLAYEDASKTRPSVPSGQVRVEHETWHGRAVWAVRKAVARWTGGPVQWHMLRHYSVLRLVIQEGSAVDRLAELAP